MGQKDDGEDDARELTGQGMPFVDWPRFNVSVGIVIIVNAVFIGLEADTGFDPEPGQKVEVSDRVFWYMAENVFCCIFFVELCLRFYFYQFSFFKSGWNCMDFVLVFLAVMDTWIMTPLGGGGNLRILSVLRVIRMMRLIRLIRLLRMFKELWMIVQGLIDSLKTLGWVTLLMILFLYVCAIFTTMQIGQNDDTYDKYYTQSRGWDHEVYFGTVTRSMFTLFQVLTLESWSEGVARHVVANQPEMVIFFLFFLIFTTFGLLNMILGVIVENTLNMARGNEEKVQKQQEKDRMKVLGHLREVFEVADEDGSGSLTQAEVREAIQNPEVANRLRLIEFPVEDPDEVFMLLDVDQTGELSIDEFISGCMRLKGPAKSKDLLAVQISVETLGKRLSLLDDKLALSGEKIALLDSKTRKMATQAEQVFLDPREMRHKQMMEQSLGISAAITDAMP